MKTNATMSPEIRCKCDGCINNEKDWNKEDCLKCARNNLSGFYEDLYLEKVF